MREEVTRSDGSGLIARLAARQHGVVSGAQLDKLGIHRQGITRRIHARRLYRIHRGVFAVGHPGLSREGRWMAAVLACGPQAALSHTSAAQLWGMLRLRRSSQAGFPAHVTVPGEGKSRRGITVHRSTTLTDDQTTRRLGIPVTTPSRTLQDLRRTLSRPRFAAALRQAEFLGLPIEPGLGPDGTRSELEAKFLTLCRRHGLPRPEVNAATGPYTVDFLWPGPALIVEVDGYRGHGGREAFEADRARDTKLKLLGYEVVRITWRQLAQDRRAVVAALRELMRRRQSREPDGLNAARK